MKSVVSKHSFAFALVALVVVMLVYAIAPPTDVLSSFACTVICAVLAGTAAIVLKRSLSRQIIIQKASRKEMWDVRLVVFSTLLTAVVVGFITWYFWVNGPASLSSTASSAAAGEERAVSARLNPLPFNGAAANLALLAALYVCTGISEECLFRGVLFAGIFSACQTQGFQRAWLIAGLTQAALFAVGHFDQMPATWSVIVVLQQIAKPLSAFAFGLVMAGLFYRARSLAVPILVHTAYDVITCMPVDMARGGMVFGYATGAGLDLLTQVISLAVFAGMSVWAVGVLAGARIQQTC